MTPPVSHRTVDVDGLSIFYREAGDRDAPVLLLAHGFPSSSRMYVPLLERLSDQYRLIAPDYPGFGHSSAPSPSEFVYSFDNLSRVTIKFTEVLGLSRYSLFMQDYGGPVGFRMAISHPERLDSLIVQNAVAHETGLGHLWQARRAFWADRAKHEGMLRQNFLSLEATRLRHIGSDPNVESYNPDLWTDEYAFLCRPGQAEIQTELFYDYRNNVAAYPKWQQWMHAAQPQLLVLWGMYDPSFDVSEAEAYRQDIREAEVHLLEAGHFALDVEAHRVTALVRRFLQRTVPH